jgi:hypothetical protein
MLYLGKGSKPTLFPYVKVGQKVYWDVSPKISNRLVGKS